MRLAALGFTLCLERGAFFKGFKERSNRLSSAVVATKRIRPVGFRALSSIRDGTQLLMGAVGLNHSSRLLDRVRVLRNKAAWREAPEHNGSPLLGKEGFTPSPPVVRPV